MGRWSLARLRRLGVPRPIVRKNSSPLAVVQAVILLVLSTGNAVAATISPDSDLLDYQGVWYGVPKQPQMTWAGSALALNFRGAELAIDFDVGAQAENFRVVIDGVPNSSPLRIAPGRSDVILATDLDPSQAHEVVFFKETYDGSPSTLFGVELSDGAELLPLPSASDRRIAFYGDSNMDGTSNYSEHDSGFAGAYFAYPAITARMLAARTTTQAYGSATLTGYGDNNVMRFIYSPDFTTQRPDFRTNFAPQVIVVNAGANDIYRIAAESGNGYGETSSSNPDTLRAQMKGRFKSVVAELRKVYGEAVHIVLYNAYGWDLNEPANYTAEVVAEVGGNLSYLHYPWTWEKWHGSMVEHGGQARLLAQHIATEMDWDIKAEPLIFDGFANAGQVANGDFEAVAYGDFEAFGWRYASEHARRECDEANCWLSLAADASVHQGFDATGDYLPGPSPIGMVIQVRAMIRGDTGALAQLVLDHEQQALYQRNEVARQHFDGLTNEWREVMWQVPIPEGSWKLYLSLGAEDGTVEFDDVRTRFVIMDEK